MLKFSRAKQNCSAFFINKQNDWRIKMHIILGGTGHVGSHLAKILKDKGEKVLVVTHDANKTENLEAQGYEVAVVDIYNSNALRKVMNFSQRAFILNPPANPSTDTDKEEHKTVNSIVEAVDGSTLRKLVVASTYGAQPIDRAGDLGVLYNLEQKLQKLPIPVSIIRSAYYMSNWDIQLQEIQKNSTLTTLFEPNLKLPMVAPQDIAKLAATLMLQPIEHTEEHSLAAFEEYSSNDVADAFSFALNRTVNVNSIREDEWINYYQKIGFSKLAAESYAKMTKIVATEQYIKPKNPTYGETTIQQYIKNLVNFSK